MAWTEQVNINLNKMNETWAMDMEGWEKQSIYKLPTSCSITDLNKKAYIPQAVSFGPYHHGEDHLLPMEKHKERALLRFLKRSDKPLQLLIDSLAVKVKDLKSSYAVLPKEWQEDDEKFIRLMILDGCFLLEILLCYQQTLEDNAIVSAKLVASSTLTTVNVPILDSDDYPYNDPIFSRHGMLHMIPHMRRDMLMLENQLPMLVLEILLASSNSEQKDYEHLNQLILKLTSPNTTGAPVQLGKCLHVLDVYRKNLIRGEKYRRDGEGSSSRVIIKSATELKEAGIRFRTSDTESLEDISFNDGILKLPSIVVDDATESMFLNLIAYEKYHMGAGNQVTSYIFFMDNIIDTEKDVELLESKEIIQNALGSDKAVAELFNSLSKETTLDPYSRLNEIQNKIKKHCQKRWNGWKANFVHTYLTNPWVIISVVAAAFLFALTIIQTVYTVYPYYQK